MKLPLIPVDKANHFVWGSLLFVLFSAVLPACIAFIITALIAGMKETVWDGLLGRGTPDPCDFGWTLFGTLPPILFHAFAAR